MNNNRAKYNEIRKKANEFRSNCKIGQYGIVNLFEDCERFGYKVIRYPLENEDLLGFSAKRDADTIIYTNTNVRLSREYFTLAHEIGHVILHFQDKQSFLDNNNTLEDCTYNDKECEANAFAAELLIPEDELSKFLDFEISRSEHWNITAIDIARIMSAFSVSFDMALNRLRELNYINDAQKIRLANEKNERRVGNLLRSVAGNSNLNEPAGVVHIPYEFLNYVISNYNSNAIPLETLQKALEYCNLTLDDIKDQITEHKEEDNRDVDLDKLIGDLQD
jgi:Zn-dependent peptidase ImmA (M78 family)